MKNAYIGEVWTPGSNTLAYFPFVNNQTDETGNCSLSATGTKQTIGYRFVTSGSEIIMNFPSNPPKTRFYSSWIKLVNVPQTLSTQIINAGGMRFFFTYGGGVSTNRFGYWEDTSNVIWSSSQSISLDNWFHLAFGCDTSNNYKGWINGVLVWSGTSTSQRTSTDTWFQSSQTATIDYSDYILETALRSNDEVAHYYNNTKSNYGL